MTEQQSSPVWVVIPAAGAGQRMQSNTPKQYLKINNKTVIEHTLDSFQSNKKVAGIVVVVSANDAYWQASFSESSTVPVFIVEGGKNRSESVFQGLHYLLKSRGVSFDSWVMVHDAARPCITKEDIDALLSIRNSNGVGGILASRVRDTMKRSLTDKTIQNKITIEKTESRDNLWHAQTPQMFRLGDLKDAITYCNDQNIAVTDECSAMEIKGHRPQIVEGSYNNIKITYSSDLELAAFLLNKERQSNQEKQP